MDVDAIGAAIGDAGQPDKLGGPAKKAKQKTPEQKAALEETFTGVSHGATSLSRATSFLCMGWPLRHC